MRPKGSQMVKNSDVDNYVPFGPLWNVDKPGIGIEVNFHRKTRPLKDKNRLLRQTLGDLGRRAHPLI